MRAMPLRAISPTGGGPLGHNPRGVPQTPGGSAMSLIPINHPMRPVFRTLGGLAGLFLFVTGVLGLVRSWGGGVFARDSVWVFGLRFNPASAAVFLLLGALVVIATVIGGQVEHFTNLIAGVAVLGIGFMALALLRFANFLNYSMTNVIVSFILG